MNRAVHPFDTTTDTTAAAYYLHGIQAGILEVDSAKGWAFDLIERRDKSPTEIIEVATSSGRGEICRNLAAIEGECDKPLAAQWLFLDIRSQISLDQVSTMTALQRAMHVVTSLDLSREIYLDFDLLDDELNLAELGTFGTVSAVRNDVMALLLKYSGSEK